MKCELKLEKWSAKRRTFFETQIVMKDTAWRLQCADNKMIISCPCLEIGQRVTL